MTAHGTIFHSHHSSTSEHFCGIAALVTGDFLTCATCWEGLEPAQGKIAAGPVLLHMISYDLRPITDYLLTLTIYGGLLACQQPAITRYL